MAQLRNAPQGAGRPVFNPSPAIQAGYLGGSLKKPVGAERWSSWQEVVDGDPNLRGRSPEEATNYLRATYGLANTYKLNDQGQITDAHNVLVRNLWWEAPLALGTAGVGSALMGGHAAALPAVTGPGALTATSTGLPVTAGLGTAGGAGATAGAVTGPAAASGFWSRFNQGLTTPLGKIAASAGFNALERLGERGRLQPYDFTETTKRAPTTTASTSTFRADPALLNEAMTNLRSVFGETRGRETTLNLPQPPALPSYTGGALPQDIGADSGQQRLLANLRLLGIDPETFWRQNTAAG